MAPRGVSGPQDQTTMMMRLASCTTPLPQPLSRKGRGEEKLLRVLLQQFLGRPEECFAVAAFGGDFLHPLLVHAFARGLHALVLGVAQHVHLVASAGGLLAVRAYRGVERAPGDG